MTKRDLVVLTGSLLAVSTLASATVASAWPYNRRYPGMSCQPDDTSVLTVGNGPSWTSGADQYAALYCPIMDSELPVIDSNGVIDMVGGDRFSAVGLTTHIIVNATGYYHASAACIVHYDAAGLSCGNYSWIMPTDAVGFHDLSLDRSAWTASGLDDYSYVYVLLGPNRSSQLQGVHVADNLTTVTNGPVKAPSAQTEN